MNSPADYYRRKRDEAAAAADALSYHQLEGCSGDPFCPTCRRLEADLDAARFVGD